MRVIVCKGTFAEGINNIEPWPECEKLENGNTTTEWWAGKIVGVATMRQRNIAMEERGVNPQLGFNSNKLNLMTGAARYKPESSGNVLVTCGHLAPSTEEEAGCSLADKLQRHLLQVLQSKKQQKKYQVLLKYMHILFTVFVPGILAGCGHSLLDLIQEEAGCDI